MVGQEPTAGLRARNKSRAHQEIAETALRLFTERGFDPVTVEDICREAGVSRRTFFRYFETKEDALLADYPRLTALLDEIVADLDEPDPLLAARRVLHKLVDLYNDSSEAVLARSNVLQTTVAGNARNLRLLAAWEAALAEVLAARLPVDRKDLRVRVAALALVSAFRVAVWQWVVSDGKDDLHDSLDQALEVIENGLLQNLPTDRKGRR
jgi:AcrR family transcriptional regulator